MNWGIVKSSLRCSLFRGTGDVKIISRASGEEGNLGEEKRRVPAWSMIYDFRMDGPVPFAKCRLPDFQ